MRALETTRLLIRAFTLADAETYSRLLDEALGAGAYGSSDEKRVVFEHQVAADAGLALLHQPPYGDRAIALRETGEVVGSVGFAPCLMPFGLLPSFEATTRFTSEIGLFWALFPRHQRTWLRDRGRDGLVIERYPQSEPAWLQSVGILESPS